MLHLNRFAMIGGKMIDGYDFPVANGQGGIILDAGAQSILENEGCLTKLVGYGRDKCSNVVQVLTWRYGLRYIGKRPAYLVQHYYAPVNREFAVIHQWDFGPARAFVIVKDNATFKKLKAEIKEDLTKYADTLY